MGRFVFKLPDVGEGVAEAEIVAWHIDVGGTIAEDDPLVDVMTDKATVEIPSPRAGRVLAINGAPGDKVRVGAELLVLDADGEEAMTPPAPEPELNPEPVAVPAPPAVATPPPSSSAPPSRAAARPLASPAIRKRAYERGLNLQFVTGTGPGGRIVHADLDAYPTSSGETKKAKRIAGEDIEEIKLIGLRRVIAERMQQSKRRIPHYAYVEELDVTAVEELRAHLNISHSDRPRLTVLPFLIAALVRAIPRFPQINALFDDEAGVVRRHAGVHVGIATQTDNGLMVPVLRHAEAMGLWEAAAEIARLALTAREGKAARGELSGSTITITSLGALGGIVSTPVINFPEVAIIGVNRIVERPVVREGRIVVRKMMNLSSSFDHRVVDGWDAARFVQVLKAMLEQPATLFID